METVTGVSVRGRYVLDLTFSDGRSGAVDLASELHGEVFESLRDPGYFSLVRLDDELGTVVWPNGADFSPEFLYQKAITSKAVRPQA